MNDFEYEELERKIAERKRIKAMCDDLKKSKKEKISASASNLAKNPVSVERAYSGGGKSTKAKTTRTAFESIQIRNGERNA